LVSWQRLGLVDFLPEQASDLNTYDHKDAGLFPEPVTRADGHLMLAMLHRPMYQALPDLENEIRLPAPVEIQDKRQCIWISYCDLEAAQQDITALRQWTGHQQLAAPIAERERLKIGAGTPPVLTHLGWLLLYHGVSRDESKEIGKDGKQGQLYYCAGAMILDREDPRRIRYRSPTPILAPESATERIGAVRNVGFPMGQGHSMIRPTPWRAEEAV
jgi:predicted GH43/DUF377 family glycosyl hydrolase